MDVRRFTPDQLHILDAATAGAFLAILHEAMIVGPYSDADVAVDFQGRGYVIEIVFGSGRDGCLGRMVRLVIKDANALPEAVRIGLMLLQVETFQRRMAERLQRHEARSKRAAEARTVPRPR